MYLRLVLLSTLLAAISCNDLEQGQNVTEARKIFDEKREASPAVWRQADKVTVNTTDAEVISRVVVTDLRPNKDGDASIVEGGEGNQTVTIELKSPTVLRGYEFHIEVYAIPDTADKKPQDVSTPAILGSDTPKDQWKPSDDDLRLNIGDVKPPSNFGADSTKPPVPLSTDVKINDGKRIARDSEETKKEDDASNHPITFVGPKELTESDLGKKTPAAETKEAKTGLQTDKAQKAAESSTHLPTNIGLKQKDEHVRHARDTEKKTQSTTQASTTIKTAKDSKDDFGPVVFPQLNVDKITGNTDKLLIPVEAEMGHDTKEVKSVKDNHSTTTTTTFKPRAVRDTEVTTSKTDVKTQQDDKHVQKIPTSGLVTIPKEWSDLHNNTAPKTSLDNKNGDSKFPQPAAPKVDFNNKNGDSKTLQPEPIFPTLNQEPTRDGPFISTTAKPAITGLDSKNGDSKTPQTLPIFPILSQEPGKNGPTIPTTKPVHTRHPTSSEESDSEESSEKVKPAGFSAPKHSGF